jgi:hypothetical protein
VARVESEGVHRFSDGAAEAPIALVNMNWLQERNIAAHRQRESIRRQLHAIQIDRQPP